jgi:PKHD-type hydroxylase
MNRGPFLVESFVARPRCDELCARLRFQGGKPRSYQGVVDEGVRKCLYVETRWSELPELSEFAARYIEPEFDVSVRANPSDVAMLYSYGEGVGFVAHHDEVTAVELRRAQRNGQPVMHGDLTIVVFLNDGDEYEGGELFFSDLGVSLKPPAGSVAVFPATRECVHGVAPISKGNRFSCVARCFVREWPKDPHSKDSATGARPPARSGRAQAP